MIKERNELLTFGMDKLFKKLAIPSMMGIVIATLYNLIDALFVGQYVGKEGVGAVALVLAAVFFNTGMFSMIGAGSSSLLSISIGKNDKRTIDKLLGNVILSVFVMSGLFSVLVFFFTSQVVSFFGGVGIVHDLGVSYLRILSVGFIFAGLGPAMNYLNRGEGKMKQAMIILGISGILNIILDWILIGVYGMGIKGAAVATVASQLFFVIVQFGYFKFGNSIIKLENVKFRFEKVIFSKVTKVGFAQFIMSVMASVQMVVLFRSLQFYGGVDHISLMGAAYRIFMFAFMFIWGLGCGLQPVVGVNFGAGQYSRVKKAFSKFKNTILIVSISIWVLALLFPSFILGFFITDAALVGENYYFFMILFSVFFLYAYQSTIVNLFLGLGKAKEAAIMMFSRQIIFFIPLVFILPLFFDIIGVWLAMPVADACTILLAIYLKNRVFKRELDKEDAPLNIDKKNSEKDLG